MKIKPNTHGGKRESAGRKSVGDENGGVIVAFRTSKAIKDEVTKRGGSEWLRQVVVRAITEGW